MKVNLAVRSNLAADDSGLLLISAPPTTYINFPAAAAPAPWRATLIEGTAAHAPPVFTSQRSTDGNAVPLVPPMAKRMPSSVATQTLARAEPIEGIADHTPVDSSNRATEERRMLPS